MNWYNNIKTAQLSHSIKKRIVGGAIAGSLATAALLALKATNPDAYQKVQNKEITIQVAAKNEVNNNFFIQEIIRVHPDYNEYSSYVQSWEGFLRNPKMLSNEKFYTIGVGHRLDGSDRSRASFAKALPDKSYSSFLSGHGSITKDEAQKLFRSDMPDYIDRARTLTGDRFSSYSTNLKKNIVSATYRGSWGYSPKTRRLLSEGRYEEAAIEFLNSDEYRNAINLGRRGIIKRMDAVAKAIREEGKKKN
ncbi:hypothetical protein CMI45_01230 [Candidatus Pacearchaeota archaeon]|nr:hypothetical protein [Candidatus Pacearchaeota archaeon]|tara:strand:+ start:263 stop:1009 length:747 start_codon:yes stop_codon:yes gene_type:complete